MRQKNIFSVLMFILLTFALSGLAAQAEGNSGLPKPKIITGAGLDLGTFIGTSKLDSLTKPLKDLLGHGKPTTFQFGVRIPFLVAFEIAKPYSLGFGGYLSLAYSSLESKGSTNDFAFGTGTLQLSSSVLYERGVLTLSPVFYNELALNKMFALSLAIGPTFALSFGDKQTAKASSTTSGVLQSAIDKNPQISSLNFIRKDAAQLSLGMLLDLGFQVKFTEMIGMGVDVYTQVYFSGQKIAADENTWWKDGEQIYQGSVGASVSFLLFL